MAELFRNAIQSIAEEAHTAIMRSAFSTNIKERRDHSAAIFDRRGRVVVQGESLPLHLSSMFGLVEVVVEKFGIENLKPGDMFASNDPFVGKGSHLPDVAIAAPVFWEGELICFVANIAHHEDIGGMAPGSMAGAMTEVYHEGMRIPPIRIVNDGQIVPDVLDLILLNVRLPEVRRGDYLAQIAANRLSERRCHELFTRWTSEQIVTGMEALIEAVAARTRSAIRDIPNGRYTFEDVMDDDGICASNIPIKVRIDVEDDHITIDFAGSSEQVLGNINLTFSGLQAAVLYAIKALVDPTGPQNHGMLDAITVKAPHGSIVDAAFPAATAARANTGQRIVDVIIGALADALPDRVVAAGNGATTTAVFSGTGPSGDYYLYMETIGGGSGARASKDGVDGVQVHMTNTSNLPVEALEREFPLIIERYELINDSGGAGQWCGGLGLRRQYRPLDHTMTFSGQGERFTNRPWGLFGGASGATGHFDVISDDGEVTRLPPKPSSVQIKPGNVLSVSTAGAGGMGPAIKRPISYIRRDLREGRVSEDSLATEYQFSLDQTAVAIEGQPVERATTDLKPTVG